MIRRTQNTVLSKKRQVRCYADSALSREHEYEQDGGSYSITTTKAAAFFVFIIAIRVRSRGLNLSFNSQRIGFVMYKFEVVKKKTTWSLWRAIPAAQK